jgi:alanyl-tRNA synthetase
VLDKTSFYTESGGQASDRGYLKDESSNLSIRIDKVLNVMGYSFHIGQVESSGDYKQIDNRQVACLIDEHNRFETTLNHTGIHLLNHSIRKCYKDEESIIQTHSSAKNDSFRFEFKFYKTFTKPTLSDLKNIETYCNDLIGKELPIYTVESVYLEKEMHKNENGLLNYPVRKLNDILYPKSVRVVSIGQVWKEFSSQTYTNSNDFSAELCCGTHATNTNQLRNVVLSHFNVVGDSSY